MPYPPQKKLLKRKEKNITPAKTNTLISQTSSERLKVTIQTYRMGNKELNNLTTKNLTWDNFMRKHQKHLCQLVLI